MPFDPGSDLTANYEQLREERGWSWETLADHVGTTDLRLAAYFRERGAGDSDQAPQGRTSVDRAQEAADAVAVSGVGGTISQAREAGERRAAAAGTPGQPNGDAEAAANLEADHQHQADPEQGSPTEASPDNETAKAEEKEAEEKAAEEKAAEEKAAEETKQSKARRGR